MAAVLAFSPHLDDAVLSIGGTLAAAAAAGQDVVVCTVFAGSPPGEVSPAGRVFHDHCGLGGDPVRTRRAEDRAALGVLGTEHLHLDFVDAVHRCQDGRWLYDAPGAAVSGRWPAEPLLLGRVTDAVAAVLGEVGPALVLTCSGLGDHVDHVLVRTAVLAASPAHDVVVGLWVDVPYTVEDRPADRLGGGAHPGAVLLDPPARATAARLEQRMAATARYGSQLRVLWPAGADWRSDLLAHAQPVTFVAADLSDGSSLPATLAELRVVVERRGAPPSVLVNNAGGDAPRRLADLDVPSAVAATTLNLVAPMVLTAAFAAQMQAAGTGAVVNIASTAGRSGVAHLSAHSAAKAGLIAFTQSAAAELSRYGVRVNCVCPGAVDTGSAAANRERLSALHGMEPQRYQEGMVSRTGLGRLLDVEEVADVVDWLVSGSGHAFTGQTVNVCGVLAMD